MKYNYLAIEELFAKLTTDISIPFFTSFARFCEKHYFGEFSAVPFPY